MSVATGTLMSELADRGESLDDEAYTCILEINCDDRWATIVWVELLQFHAEFNGGRSVARDGYDAPDDWKSLVDRDGWLTEESLSAVSLRLLRLMPPGELTVESSPHATLNKPNVVLEIVTHYDDGETFDQWFDRIGWPVVATLRNVTNPGTFNSPYLFSDLEPSK